ncbi:MAG: iron-containing alcohol dehydrogenase, partial [Prevotella sp.]|nr:iron-containing alcohol dehydrogenase [Prevotella sp.]
MKRFDYEFPVRIHFGRGCFEDSLKKELQKYGKRVMLAYGGGSLKRTGLYDRIVTMLNEAGKTVTDFGGIMPNPTYAKVLEGARLAREQDVDFILAVGGGSVSDCCKIVSAQARLDSDIWDYEYVEHKVPTDFIPLGVIVT